MSQPSHSISNSSSVEQGTSCLQIIGLLVNVLTFLTVYLFNKKIHTKKLLIKGFALFSWETGLSCYIVN